MEKDEGYTMRENDGKENNRRHGRGRNGRNDRRHGGHGRRPVNREEEEKIQRLLRDINDMLADSDQAICLEDLSAYERKRVHQFFDHKADFETKTYRNGEDYLLWIFPLGKLRQLAEARAQEALQTGKEIDLPPMSNYERFIIHDALKDWQSVETASFGEGEERHIRIKPIRFGRKLKKIVKKIKFF